MKIPDWLGWVITATFFVVAGWHFARMIRKEWLAVMLDELAEEAIEEHKAGRTHRLRGGHSAKEPRPPDASPPTQSGVPKKP